MSNQTYVIPCDPPFTELAICMDNVKKFMVYSDGVKFGDETCATFDCYCEDTIEMSFSGFTSTPTDMVQLTKSGRMITMSFINGFSATYSAGIPRSQLPLPTHYIPASPKVIPCLIENQLAMQSGYLMVDETGYISFYVADPETLSPGLPVGIPQGLTVIYTL